MKGLCILLSLFCVSCSMVPLPNFGSPKGEAPIPKASLSSVACVSPSVIRVVQDNSGVVVLSASAPVTTKEPEVSFIRVRVSAYCPCHRCTPGNGITSTGSTAWKPGVAADPSWLSYGTRVFVEGYGEAMVDDTGAAMRRKRWVNGLPRLDLRMTYHWQARDFGIKYLDVKVYKH